MEVEDSVSRGMIKFVLLRIQKLLSVVILIWISEAARVVLE